MKHVPATSLLAAVLVALISVPLAGQSFAQTTAPAQPPAAEPAALVPSARPDKTILRIRTEDSGTRIDEVRVGGETQSITVQPKVGENLPAYEVKPSLTTRGGAPSPSSSDTNGSRVWNVLKF